MRHCGESFVFWILIFLKAWRNTSLGEGKHLQEGRGDGGRWHLIPGTLISCRGGIYIQHNHLNFDLHNAVIFGHGTFTFTCIVKILIL